jgi:hypothetical protein
MTDKKQDDIDPTVRRSLGESAAHNAKTRELITDFATSRGAPAPPAPEPNRDFEEELITARHDIEELQRAAKSSQLSVRVPGGSGIRVAGLIGWQVMVILVALAAIGAWAWVQTHSITIATPVPLPVQLAPAHS